MFCSFSFFVTPDFIVIKHLLNLWAISILLSCFKIKLFWVLKSMTQIIKNKRVESPWMSTRRKQLSKICDSILTFTKHKKTIHQNLHKNLNDLSLPSFPSEIFIELWQKETFLKITKSIYYMKIQGTQTMKHILTHTDSRIVLLVLRM